MDECWLLVTWSEVEAEAEVKEGEVVREVGRRISG